MKGSSKKPFSLTRNIFLPVLIHCLVIPSFFSTSHASNIEDLHLATKKKHWVSVTLKTSNPHDFSCDECHQVIHKTGEEPDYILPDDSIALCKSCHTGPNIHPVDIAPEVPQDKASYVWLPLGKGKRKGRIVCLTCHYTHSSNYFSNLIRGDDSEGKHRREFLCSSCHGTSLREKSPHSASSSACSFCHTKTPVKGENLSAILKPDIQNRCNFCHNTLREGHYLSLNPFSDPGAAPQDMDIPLFMGRFTCISCHDPHATQNRRQKMLRRDYLKLAADSNRINPHWKDVMCISCHDREPVIDDPALKFNGDINLLCNRCHDGIVARNDVHPTNKAPTENVSIPSAMPLKNGKLTCETCHDSSLQEGGEKGSSVGRTNPKFLRDGFVTRNEFCFRCHIQEQYGKLNAHNQMDESGSINNQRCLFCHSSLPDLEVAGTGTEEFDIDSLDEYCTVCHASPRYLSDHPVGEHLVEPSRDVYEAIETSTERIGVELPMFNDKITCVTCHNPHQQGVIRIHTAATGAGAPSRLRLEAGRWQCVGCHLGKGGQ
jgi:hypothetical protein